MRVSAFGLVSFLALSTVIASPAAYSTPALRYDAQRAPHEDMHHEGENTVHGEDGSEHSDKGTNTTLLPSTTHPAHEIPPDPHAHHHSSEPAKTVLNDAEIHKWHTFPPTYLAADFRLTNDSAIFGEDFGEDWDPDTAGGHLGSMVVHVGAMIVAYFGALPLALALRAAGHSGHYIVNAGFMVIALFGWLAGVAYKAQTPDRYEGAVHGSFGNILLLVSVGLAGLDSLGLFNRVIAYFNRSDRSWNTFLQAISHKDNGYGEASRYEMVGLTEHDQHEPVFALGDDDDEPHERPRLLRQNSPPSRSSTGSEGTLHDTPSSSNPFPKKQSTRDGAFDQSMDIHGEAHVEIENAREPVWKEMEQNRMKRALEITGTVIRRTQIVIAYVVLLTGISTYTGMCRAGYINTCAAHLIKGSIFFLYGVFSFARYLGAYADLGWAWNRRPDGRDGISAEMVECTLIFVYGITNTWMERFGAAPGSPYDVKTVQHISIAVMFWFAGLMGMLLESKRVRKILAAVTNGGNTHEPASFSFNPLPAIVIAITGLAMAAHHQEYAFQVSIHSLWGILLALGSLFRCLTYFFLYLSPPTASMPGRPPTEVLTSFGMTSGGIVFMLSTEEVTFAAMRSGYDDVMAFLNVTVALNSLIFCWVLVVLAVKGMGVMRVRRAEMVGSPSAVGRA